MDYSSFNLAQMHKDVYAYICNGNYHNPAKEGFILSPGNPSAGLSLTDLLEIRKSYARNLRVSAANLGTLCIDLLSLSMLLIPF